MVAQESTRCRAEPVAAIASSPPPPARAARPGRRPSRRARCAARPVSRNGRAIRSSSSSPRTCPSASATVRRNSSSSAVTCAARSRIRWSASTSSSPGAAPARPGSRRRPPPPRTRADPGRTLRPSVAGRGHRLDESAAVRLVDLTDPGQQPALRVQRQQRAAEHLGHRGRHVLHAAAAQHQRGHPVVRRRGPLDRARCAPGWSCWPPTARPAPPRVSVEQPGGVDRDRGVRGQRDQQRHLLPGERPVGAVGREQHADRRWRRAAAARRGSPPGPPRPPRRRSRRCAGSAGRRRSSAVTYGVPDWATRPPRPAPDRQPQPLEAGRHRAVGDPHVGVAALVVVERHVRDVGAEQGARPVHDRPQHGVEVAQAGQVARRVVQRGQLVLPAAAPLQQRAYPQRQRPWPAPARPAGRRGARRPARPPAGPRTRPPRPRGRAAPGTRPATTWSTLCGAH